MCLAVPGKIVRKVGEVADIDMQGNRLEVSMVLVPEARVDDYVLVHAGFAIQRLSEQEARETFDLLKQIETAE
jgi:hydrogenase expression/formation protein HypC